MKWKFWKRNKESSHIPEPDWVVEKRKCAKELSSTFAFEKIEGEILPPWLEYPEILIGSIGWRMGAGETFLHEVFFPYWRALNSNEQNAYVEKYDLGAQWQDRNQWLESLERNKSSAKQST